MWTAVFEFTVDPGNRAAFQATWDEFAALRERQAGFRGTIEVDAGESRMMCLVLWESYTAHEAAYAASDAAAMEGAFNRAFALMAVPTKGLAAGEVTGDSLSTAEPFGNRPVLAFFNEAVIASDQRVAYDEENRTLWSVRAQQPGFVGSIEFDAGEGRIVWLAIWTSREALQAARESLMSTVDRVHVPVISRGPLGAGTVVRNTITRRTASTIG